MAAEKIFVGRKDELKQFTEVLKDPRGQAVLVVGQAGMGKSMLVNEVAKLAEKGLLSRKGAKLKCWSVCYRVTPTDAVNAIMEQIIVDATEAASPIREKLGMTGANKEKWGALFGIGEFVPVFGKKIRALGDLLLSWGQKKTGETRKRFVQALVKLSDCMSDNQRAIFIIDPEKYLQEKSDYSWGLVVDKLPDKVKFVFPQRPDDVIVKGEGFDGLDNVVRIPEGQLVPFEKENVEELVRIHSTETPELRSELRDGAMRSDRSPYSVSGTLELITLAGMSLDELGKYLTQKDVAKAQWRGICERGNEAVRFFKAYAILEVAVPDNVVEAVSGLKSSKRRQLLADKYLRGLLREEESRRIYHAILADYILGQIGEGEKKEYHGRAVTVYREKLANAKKNKTKPNGLAAMRLAEHVLEAEGKEAFVDAFVNECTQPFLDLGLLDTAMNLSERALQVVETGSEKEAMLYGNLGLIYRRRGKMYKAEEMFHKVLEIEDKLVRTESIANAYGNLGLIYEIKGDSDRAKQMHRKSLEIWQKLGRPEGVAREYGNIGVLYWRCSKLDKAKEMCQKALEIYERLGELKGISINLSNLGLIYHKSGDLDKAEKMHHKALVISERLGLLEGMVIGYSNLGRIYMERGNLDRAEKIHKKSLKISEQHGLVELTAISCANLGTICQQEGDFEKARQYWEKAVGLYKKIGMKKDVEKVEGWLDGLK